MCTLNVKQVIASNVCMQQLAEVLTACFRGIDKLRRDSGAAVRIFM
jgi:hypothetical protein